MTSISKPKKVENLSFEQKALDYLAEVVINKSLIYQAGFGGRAIPTYVGEWLISRYMENGEFTEDSRIRIAEFIAKYLPAKGITHKLSTLTTCQDRFFGSLG